MGVWARRYDLDLLQTTLTSFPNRRESIATKELDPRIREDDRWGAGGDVWGAGDDVWVFGHAGMTSIFYKPH